MNPYSDESLMEKVKDGQLGQMSLLFERYHKELYHYFYRLSQDVNDSKDLCQQVFLRMIKYKNTFHRNKKFKVWMYRIAKNVWFDLYKKRQKDKKQLKNGIHESGISSNRGLGDSEETQKLEVAIKRLSEDQQELLIMHFYQNIKAPEIAEILQISPNNVRVRTHRAIKALRKEFKKINKERTNGK